MLSRYTGGAAAWPPVRPNSSRSRTLTAIRDSENRVLALGYNPAAYKIFIFAFASALAGIAGALYTAANGLAGPGYLEVTFSIFFVILVAVGGRGTLFGAVLGAVFPGEHLIRVKPDALRVGLGPAPGGGLAVRASMSF